MHGMTPLILSEIDVWGKKEIPEWEWGMEGCVERGSNVRGVGASKGGGGGGVALSVTRPY